MSAFTAIAARLTSSAGVQQLGGGIAAARRAMQMLPAPQQQRSLGSGRAVLAALPAVHQPAIDVSSGDHDAAGGALTRLRGSVPETAAQPSVEAEKRSWHSAQAAALPDTVHGGQSQQQRLPPDLQVDAEHEQHPHSMSRTRVASLISDGACRALLRMHSTEAIDVVYILTLRGCTRLTIR